MPRFRSRRFRGSSKPVHPVTWLADEPFSSQGDTASSGTHTIVASADFENYTSPTIVRVRGDVSAHLIKTDADAAECITVQLGIALREDNLITAGDLTTRAVMEEDWMWLGHAELWSVIKWEPAVNSSGTVISLQPTTMTVAGVTHHRFDIDIKAMRRVPKNQNLFLQWTWEQTTETADLRIASSFRVLVKE